MKTGQFATFALNQFSLEVSLNLLPNFRPFALIIFMSSKPMIPTIYTQTLNVALKTQTNSLL